MRLLRPLLLLAVPAAVAAQTPARRPAAAAAPAPATPSTDAQRYVGYAPRTAERQRDLERRATALPHPDSARRWAAALSREPHVAGTDAQARTRDYVVGLMKGWGLETEVRAYDVYLPHATGVKLWRVAPDTAELPLEEGPVAGDPVTAMPQYPTVNGYSAAGDATGEVVFVNYGLIEDYKVLDSIGVSVRGKVVLARFGRSFRGIKAREAEKRGAVALLIYTDPADDGFTRGDVYPEGPMRPEQGVQRGSIFNGTGDPTTPGTPSTKGATRIPVAQSGVPKIPVAPIAWRTAAALLRDVRGAAIPHADWQGAMPFRYHVGPGPVRARLQVTTDEATRPMKTIWNTFGIIRGSERPDELVIVGAHRDAWNAGAVDNVSGTVSVLEAARTLAALARGGERPKRTVVFATWDAEEWGLVGSTEHVEDDSLRLMRGGVAYLNQDVSASGPAFGGGGSPSLRETLRDVVRGIPDPSGTGSIYATWRRRANVAEGAEPSMGDPGGGSDFAGFYNHLGIPHADWGFGGPWGVYHSAFDTHRWMSRFGDSSFAYHAAAARVGAASLLRLANAELLPYDYAELARTLRPHAERAGSAAWSRGWQVNGDTLVLALGRLERAATAWAAARDAALRGGLTSEARVRANSALLRVERALTRPQGLRSRPWYRNLVYASDMDNGYSTMVLPSINEALRYGDAAQVAAELADLAARVDEASRSLDAARNAVANR